jgi:hypothetical protein
VGAQENTDLAVFQQLGNFIASVAAIAHPASREPCIPRAPRIEDGK